MTPASLFDLVQAPVRWQVLKAALELGLVDVLTEERSAEDVARCLGLDCRRTDVLLHAMAAGGLAVKTDGRFRLPPDLAPYLCRDGLRSMRDLLLTIWQVRHADVADLVRTGSRGEGPDMASAAFWDRSADSLRAFHRSMGTDTALALLQSLPEWPQVRTFLDLGAGSGRLAQAVAAADPQRRATVLDLPPMAERIVADLRGTAEEGRVQVMAGDFNSAPLGGGYDLIWAAMTLYFARDLGAVLTAVRQALAPGGVFVSFHEGLTPDLTGPEIHVVGRLVPALRGQARSFRQGEIAAALRQSGFTRVDSRPVETPFGLMQADIAHAS